MSERDENQPTNEEYAEFKKLLDEGGQDPREMVEQVSKITLLIGYDLIDKVRYLEKETLGLPDDEIPPRLKHLVDCLDRLRAAHLEFSDVDL
ncbi:MAG: hypothetical protein GY716_22230 [bacterium]|nr:hypothetical protein [bacterium]